MKPFQQVVDETKAIHTLVKRIGVGGQGEVWLTEGGRRIVKLLNRSHEAEVIRQQFAFVRRLDLSGLHVARPIAVLKQPHIGYVAEFLGEMVAMKTLLSPSENLLEWHIRTGGLRRRLRLLAHAGEVLMGLHARGIIYADISHNNIFISEPVHALEAWFIDLDNLRHDEDPRRNIYTPGYGAPEVVAGSAGCTSLSDAWSFSVLAWNVLTLVHPFVGDWVSDGEPELEEQAYAGTLPWVGHSKDHQNVCSTGLPPKTVMAGRLVELAQRTFEDGLQDRKKRPGVSEWVERLHTAADQTITCPGCTGSYFVTETFCPWCGESPPAFGVVKLARWLPDKGIVEGITRPAQLPLSREGLVLPRRITTGIPGLKGREPHIELLPTDRGVSIRAIASGEAWVAPISKPSQNPLPVAERARIVPSDGWMVFFEAPDKPQRVAILGSRR